MKKNSKHKSDEAPADAHAHTKGEQKSDTNSSKGDATESQESAPIEQTMDVPPPAHTPVQDAALEPTMLPEKSDPALDPTILPEKSDPALDPTMAPEKSDARYQPTVMPNELDSNVAPGTNVQFGSSTYRIGKTLGKGGQGTVLLAHDDALDRDVAIKKANPDMDGTTSGAANSNLFGEAQAIASLDHQNIVPIYSLEKDGDALWFVYKYIKGGTLADKMDAAEKDPDKAMTPRESATLIAKMASALEAVHERGFCHRDVKPENILLGEKGKRIYLADFGVVMPLDESKRPKGHAQCAGTLSYMSPEQAGAGLGEDRRVDQRSDVFCLGLVLHEMLSGGKKVYPRTKDTNQIALMKIVANDEPIEPPKNEHTKIPVELQRICMKALDKDPEKRYQSAAEMEMALWQYLDKGKSKSSLVTKVLLAGLLSSTAGLALMHQFSKSTTPPPRPAATAPAEPPMRKFLRTTKDDIDNLRNWEVSSEKTVNILDLIDPQYQKGRSSSSRDQIGVRNEKGEIEKRDNTFNNYLESLQCLITGNGDARTFETVLQRLMPPTEESVNLALRYEGDESRPFNLSPQEYHDFLKDHGLKDTPEVKQKLSAGIAELSATIEDYNAHITKRIKELSVVSGPVEGSEIGMAK